MLLLRHKLDLTSLPVSEQVGDGQPADRHGAGARMALARGPPTFGPHPSAAQQRTSFHRKIVESPSIMSGSNPKSNDKSMPERHHSCSIHARLRRRPRPDVDCTASDSRIFGGRHTFGIGLSTESPGSHLRTTNQATSMPRPVMTTGVPVPYEGPSSSTLAGAAYLASLPAVVSR